MGDEPLAVRSDFYGLSRRLCLHFLGVLLGGSANRISQEPGGRSRRISSGAYRWIRALGFARRAMPPRSVFLDKYGFVPVSCPGSPDRVFGGKMTPDSLIQKHGAH